MEGRTFAANNWDEMNHVMKIYDQIRGFKEDS